MVAEKVMEVSDERYSPADAWMLLPETRRLGGMILFSPEPGLPWSCV